MSASILQAVCPPTWDGASCLPPTLAGNTAILPCMTFYDGVFYSSECKSFFCHFHFPSLQSPPFQTTQAMSAIPMEPGTARQIIQIACAGGHILKVLHVQVHVQVNTSKKHPINRLNVFFSMHRGSDQHFNHSICQPEHHVPSADSLPIVIHLVGKFSKVQVHA